MLLTCTNKRCVWCPWITNAITNAPSPHKCYYKCYHKCYDKPQCTQHDCVWVCLCVHVRACACVCMRARMCGCVCVYSYIYIYIYMYISTFHKDLLYIQITITTCMPRPHLHGRRTFLFIWWIYGFNQMVMSCSEGTWSVQTKRANKKSNLLPRFAR